MKIVIHWRDGIRPATEIANVGEYRYRADTLRLWSADRSTVRDIYLGNHAVESVTFTDLTEREYERFVDKPSWSLND